jgi:uncharacterized protein DUF5648
MKKILISSLFVFSFYCGFSQQPLFRYYNGKIKKHYYTVNFNEYGNGRNGWALEGPACLVYTVEDRQRDIVPFLRYFNPRNGDHYYTIHKHELGQGADGYNFEGTACFINKFQAPGTVPLFEYLNTKMGDHFYTVDKRELGHGFDGYEFTGIAGYVFLGRNHRY